MGRGRWEPEGSAASTIDGPGVQGGVGICGSAVLLGSWYWLTKNPGFNRLGWRDENGAAAEHVRGMPCEYATTSSECEPGNSSLACLGHVWLSRSATPLNPNLPCPALSTVPRQDQTERDP